MFRMNCLQAIKPNHVPQVSASGDGKMILWDIESGKRLRTFEGHDRGLACIEFKVSFLCHCKSLNLELKQCSRVTLSHLDRVTGRLRFGQPPLASACALWSDTTRSFVHCRLIHAMAALSAPATTKLSSCGTSEQVFTLDWIYYPDSST